MGYTCILILTFPNSKLTVGSNFIVLLTQEAADIVSNALDFPAAHLADKMVLSWFQNGLKSAHRWAIFRRAR
jgi:hypothetical protein